MLWEWGVHASVSTENTRQNQFPDNRTLYEQHYKSRQDLNQTIPFIRSYSILKFDYRAQLSGAK